MCVDAHRRLREAKLSIEPAENVVATDDEALVRQVCLGEKERFAELVGRHQRIVFRIVHGILNRPMDSEVVLQESFLKVYTHLGEFRGQAEFRTWLIRIAINEAKMRLREYRAPHFQELWRQKLLDRLAGRRRTS